MSRKSEDREPLVNGSLSQNDYGAATGNDDVDLPTPTSDKPTFKGLLYCASNLDKFYYLLIGLALNILSSLLSPIALLVNMGPISAVLPYEQKARFMIQNHSIPETPSEILLTKEGKDLLNSARNALIAATSIAIAQLAVSFAYMYISGLIANRICRKMREKYLFKVLSLDMSWSQNSNPGELTAMLEENISKINDALENNLPQAVSIGWNTIFTILFSFAIRWDVTLIMFCFLAAALLLYYAGTKFVQNGNCTGSNQFVLTITSLATHPIYGSVYRFWFRNLVSVIFPFVSLSFLNIAMVYQIRRQQNIASNFQFGKSTERHYVRKIALEQGYLGKAAEIANEAFVCIKTVICFNGQPQTILKFKDRVADAMHESRIRAFWSALADSTKIVLLDTLVIVSLWYGITNLNDMDPAALFAIVQMGSKLGMSIPMLNVHINAVVVAVGCAHRVNKVLELSPEIEVEAGECLDSVGPEICFENVTFSYPSRPDMKVLDGVSFRIRRGDRIAVVGESGCGKSTICALIHRFFDPDSGYITIDGRPLTQLNVHWLRENFGYVPQEPVLFNLSIKDNVQCSTQAATHSEVKDALRRANALDFILEMPDGLETYAGERGTQLSGGQKQRIAIARAMLRDPAVLIFDEATSSLDTESEAVVQAAIEQASEGRTTLTIAHRLSTILNSTQVLVMDKGKIIESGPPQELIKHRRIFYRMLKEQNVIGDDGQFYSSETSDPEMSATSPRRRRKLRGYKRRSSYYSCSSDTEQHPMLKSLVSSTTADSELYIQPEADEEGEVSTIESSEEDRPRVIRKEKTSWALQQLAALHPRSAQLLGVITVAGAVRGFKLIFNMVIMVAQLDALSYPEEVMEERVETIVIIFAFLTVFCFLAELAMYIPVPLYADELTSRIRSSMLTHYLSQNLEFFDQSSHNSGALSSGLSSHAANIRETVSGKVPEFVTATMASVGALLLAMCLNPLLTLTGTSLYGIMNVMRLLETRAMLKEQRKLQPLQAQAMNLASDALTNLDTVKAYGLENWFCERFKEQYLILEKKKGKRIMFNSFLVATMTSLPTFNMSLAIYVGIHMMLDDPTTTLFEVFCCVMLSRTVCFRLMMVLTQSRMIARCLASCNFVAKTLVEPIKVNNLSNAGIKEELEGGIHLSQVTFAYPIRPEHDVFRKLNLKIKPLSTVAVVGPSGSGKSTVLQLILRLYDCDTGQVKIDDNDIRTFNPAHLHQSIAIVSQEPILFQGTIWENITYGLVPQQVDYDQVQEAATNANIHDFIASLPEGYDTEVGQLGAKLSGGQKQRIAIARALIRKPKILLLDEATAALDTNSEASVQAALHKAQATCTCVVVAHRLSTVRNADQIVVLTDGKVLEKGSHVRLMNNQGLYYNMVMRQKSSNA